jgi:hypothetical protein
VSDVFDKILASRPVNKAAGAVLGRGVHWDGSGKEARKTWDGPPKTRPVPANVEDLTGVRFGRLVVLGLMDGSQGKPRWVVRCSCGLFEVRKGQAVKNPENANDRCSKCGYWHHLRRREIYDRTGQWPPDQID